MFNNKSSKHPEKNAQLLVRQLTQIRRNERLKNIPMENQVQIAWKSLVRKGVVLNEQVLNEARRRIHSSHEQTIRKSVIVERANGRADTILDMLKKLIK